MYTHAARRKLPFYHKGRSYAEVARLFIWGNARIPTIYGYWPIAPFALTLSDRCEVRHESDRDGSPAKSRGEGGWYAGILKCDEAREWHIRVEFHGVGRMGK
jgi:hypothetical protein